MNGQNLPPNDPPNELLLRLLQRPAASALVDLPSRSTNGTPLAQIRILVLRQEQHDEARSRAEEKLKAQRRVSDLKSTVGAEILGDAVAKELLAMACHMADPIDPTADNPVYPLLFRSAQDVGKLSADEVTALFGSYLLVQKKYGPFARDLDEDEVNAWIERLTEGASALPLGQLPSQDVAELCLCLARRALCLSKLLDCQQKSLPIPWESVPPSFRLDTGSSSEPVADSIPSSEAASELITQEQAKAAARAIIGDI